MQFVQESMAGFVGLLHDEEIPFYRKQSLVSALLLADGADQFLDAYQAMVAEEGASYPPMDELYEGLRRGASQLLQVLFQQSRKGSALADDFLMAIFTRQSLCLLKYLFEEAERGLVGSEGDVHRSILPMVLLLLEDRFLNATPSEEEVASILDRLNLVYARLDLETFEEIRVEIARIRQESDRPSPFSEDHLAKVEVYKKQLSEAVEQVKAAQTVAEMLGVVNERRNDIVAWERLLMLDVDLRVALKRYHNTNTELFTAEARRLADELAVMVLRRPSRGGRLLLQSLDRAVRAGENIGRVVGRALVAEGYVSTLRKLEHEPVLARAEVKQEMERIGKIQHKGTATILKELATLRLSRRDELLVARRLLEGARLTRAMREELESLVLTRQPGGVIRDISDRFSGEGGPSAALVMTELEQAIEEEDGAWLAHGGETGFSPEFELGFEAATLQRRIFPGRTDAAGILDRVLTSCGFSFAEVKNRGGKPAFVYRFVVSRGKQKELDQGPPSETDMKSPQDGRAQEMVRAFEREVKALASNLEIRVAQLGKVSDELTRIPAALDGIKLHYRPLIGSNRRLAEKLSSFEAVVRGIVDPLVKATEKARKKGDEVSSLISSQMASDDQRRELVDLLSRLLIHDLTAGLGNYTKLKEDMQDVLESALPRGTPEWDVLDLPKLKYLLVARNFSATNVALLMSQFKLNERFFVDLKPRKAVRCRMDRIQGAVYGGLF